MKLHKIDTCKSVYPPIDNLVHWIKRVPQGKYLKKYIELCMEKYIVKCILEVFCTNK